MKLLMLFALSGFFCSITFAMRKSQQNESLELLETSQTIEEEKAEPSSGLSSS